MNCFPIPILSLDDVLQTVTLGMTTGFSTGRSCFRCIVPDQRYLYLRFILSTYNNKALSFSVAALSTELITNMLCCAVKLAQRAEHTHPTHG